MWACAAVLVVVACLSASCSIFGGSNVDKLAALVGASGQSLTPMVVDWRPEDRGDLEVAMKRGVAVLTYNDDTLRVLPECHLDGSYGFVPMVRKEEVVRLTTADEVAVNLPAQGPALAAQLEGKLGLGTSVDVAMVMVGQTRTTWRAADKQALVGSCAGATHFVRGATLGAFAMQTGETREAVTAATIFGVGGAVSSSATQLVRRQDGDLGDCAAATPDAAAAPGQCAALIRLEVVPLGGGADTTLGWVDDYEAEVDEPPESDMDEERWAADRCPLGFAWWRGKCAPVQDDVLRSCDADDRSGCARLCALDDATSCYRLGLLAWREGGEGSQAEAARLTERACEAGVLRSCTFYGMLRAGGYGVDADPRVAAASYQKACEGGEAVACGMLGFLVELGRVGEPDPAGGLALFERACRGGSQDHCSELGNRALMRSDFEQAATFYKRACDGGSAVGCSNLAYMAEFGRAVPRDSARAFALYRRACAESLFSCPYLAPSYMTGEVVAVNEDAARKLYKAACNAGDVYGCAALNAIFGSRRPLRDEDLGELLHFWDASCANGIERDCAQAGVVYYAQGERRKGRALVNAACERKDAWACALNPRFNPMGAPPPPRELAPDPRGTPGQNRIRVPVKKRPKLDGRRRR